MDSSYPPPRSSSFRLPIPKTTSKSVMSVATVNTEYRCLSSNYTCIFALGKGAAGTVWLCKRLADDRRVVTKQISVDENDSAFNASQNEVVLLRRLSHPFVIKYLESFIDTEFKSFYIVMEWAENDSLAHAIQLMKNNNHNKSISASSTTFPIATIITWITQLILGLQYLHEEKVLHRDIKPSNILLDSNYDIKIADFGVAKLLQNAAQFSKTTVGTPYYLSPELCTGNPYNEKSDIWAVGCVLYELCCLERPFQGTNLHAIVLSICHSTPSPLPSEYQLLQPLVDGMLRKEQELRLSTNDILEFPVIATCKKANSVCRGHGLNASNIRPPIAMSSSASSVSSLSPGSPIKRSESFSNLNVHISQPMPPNASKAYGLPSPVARHRKLYLQSVSSDTTPTISCFPNIRTPLSDRGETTTPDLYNEETVFDDDDDEDVPILHNPVSRRGPHASKEDGNVFTRPDRADTKPSVSLVSDSVKALESTPVLASTTEELWGEEYKSHGEVQESRSLDIQNYMAGSPVISVRGTQGKSIARYHSSPNGGVNKQKNVSTIVSSDGGKNTNTSMNDGHLDEKASHARAIQRDGLSPTPLPETRRLHSLSPKSPLAPLTPKSHLIKISIINNASPIEKVNSVSLSPVFGELSSDEELDAPA